MGRIKDIFDGLASFGKVLLLSHLPSAGGKVKTEPIIILGNGPSLKNVVTDKLEILTKSTTLAVNYAANTDAFSKIRPSYYVLTDPNFFNLDAEGKSSNPNVDSLWEALSKLEWDMTLFLPFKKKYPAFIKKNGRLKIKKYNMTPGEGIKRPVHWLYRHGWAMPRPRNVLIASIMIALREGFREIYIVGADHNWTQDLWVDEKNRLITVQKHFYKDNEKEQKFADSVYSKLRLHDVLGSLAIAFRSYHQIANFADEIGATIINSTPGSFVDAFPRGPLPGVTETENEES